MRSVGGTKMHRIILVGYGLDRTDKPCRCTSYLSLLIYQHKRSLYCLLQSQSSSAVLWLKCIFLLRIVDNCLIFWGLTHRALCVKMQMKREPSVMVVLKENSYEITTRFGRTEWLFLFYNYSYK